MQIVVVGAGKVGFTVVAQLDREGHEVTVVESNPNALDKILEAVDVAAYLGTCVDKDVLMEAGVAGADLFMALTGDDELNLLSCLLARKLGAKNTIARVRRPDFANAIPIFAGELGLSMTVNPEKEAALEMTRILELPLAKKVETFAKGRVEMIDYDVAESSPMCGKPVREVFANMRSALVAAVERDGEIFIPLGDFEFRAGDTMTMIAPAGKMSEFFKKSGEKYQNVKHVIISGGGRTGFYLARELLSQHIRVTIIEKDEKVAAELAATFPNADIFVGDGTSKSVLEEMGIARADAFCCLTGIDEENILTSLHAKMVAPGIKTVTKINRVELVQIVKPLGIGSVVSPKLIAADRVVSYVRAKQSGAENGVLTLYRIVDDRAEAIEFLVTENSRLAGVPIKDLPLKKDVLLACINRKGTIISPRGNDALQKGDTVIVVTTHTGFDELDDIIRG